jgi:probable phosphoglycerate mutase
MRAVPPRSPTATRLVLVRHGEAVCNVNGVCGGVVGCQGLTDLGRAQVGRLAARLTATGELGGTDVLVASVLPRAIETAAILAPALAAPGGTPPPVEVDCDVCELHPGAADGLTWEDYVARFGSRDWDADPHQPIAPGGESWVSFVTRVDGALDRLVDGGAGRTVVVACHAGVVEASMLAKLPMVDGRSGLRLQLRTTHASLTTWEVDDDRWRLLAYNDAGHLAGAGQG